MLTSIPGKYSAITPVLPLLPSPQPAQDAAWPHTEGKQAPHTPGVSAGPDSASRDALPGSSSGAGRGGRSVPRGHYSRPRTELLPGSTESIPQGQHYLKQDHGA